MDEESALIEEIEEMAEGLREMTGIRGPSTDSVVTGREGIMWGYHSPTVFTFWLS